MKIQHISSFKDLIVYQRCRSVSRKISEITKSFPKYEVYSLTGRILNSMIEKAFCGSSATKHKKLPRRIHLMSPHRLLITYY